MDLFIKVMGYIFIIVLVGVVILIFIIRHFWSKIKKMGESFEPLVMEIDPDPKWIDKPEIRNLIQQFHSIGFEVHRVYKETGHQIKPLILANQARTEFGEVYLTPRQIITGFTADTEAGMSLNVTTDNFSDVYAIKPHKIIQGYPEAGVAELYEKFKNLVADQPLKVIPDEQFDQHLMDSINKDTQVRFDSHEIPLWQDGEQDFVGRWQKHHKDTENLYRSYEQLAADSIRKIGIEISDSLGQAEDLSASTFNQYSNNFLIFNERFHKIGFRDYLEELFICEDDVQSERLKELAEHSSDTKEFFEAFKSQFPKLKLKRFYSVTTPIEAELWGYTDDEESDEN